MHYLDDASWVISASDLTAFAQCPWRLARVIDAKLGKLDRVPVLADPMMELVAELGLVHDSGRSRSSSLPSASSSRFPTNRRPTTRLRPHGEAPSRRRAMPRWWPCIPQRMHFFKPLFTNLNSPEHNYLWGSKVLLILLSAMAPPGKFGTLSSPGERKSQRLFSWLPMLINFTN